MVNSQPKTLDFLICRLYSFQVLATDVRYSQIWGQENARVVQCSNPISPHA